MTSLLEQFDDYFTGGDPYIRQLFLVRTITPMITIVTCYVLFVTTIGPAIMKNRKPFNLRNLIIYYNFALVIYYFYFLLKGAYFFYQLGLSTFCDTTMDTENPFFRSFYMHGYELYIIRYIELVDTVFLVLTKKFEMITPLHVFHHAIVPVFGWFGFRSEKSTYLALFMGINSFVHVIMYFYYAVAALGPEYQKYIWWKRYLTFLQISQFFVMTIYLISMYAIGCVTSKLTVFSSSFLSVLFFFLFINYYRRTFSNKDKVEQRNGHQNGSAHVHKKLSVDKTQ